MKNRARGFTIVELILVVAVGSLLVLGITLFTAQQVSNGSQMRDFLEALDLARLKMAEMNNTTYASLPVGTTTLTGEPSFPGLALQRVVTLVNTGAPNPVTLRRIDIKVDHTGGTFANPLIQLTTYRESNTTFGDGV